MREDLGVRDVEAEQRGQLDMCAEGAPVGGERVPGPESGGWSGRPTAKRSVFRGKTKYT